jgi:phage terminase large subunit-like protein
LPPTHLPVHLCGDLSYGSSEKSDETCLWAFRCWQGSYFFFDCDAGRWNANDLVEHTLKFINKWRPGGVHLEGGHAHDAIENLLIARAKDFGLYKLPILEWLKPSNKKDAKFLRISALNSWMVGRRIFIFKHIPNNGYEKLVQQLLRFPRSGGKDDRADAMSLALEANLGLQFETTAAQQQRADNSMLKFLHNLQPKPKEDDYDSRPAGSFGGPEENWK